jgi:DNA-binding ferritin-like protein
MTSDADQALADLYRRIRSVEAEARTVLEVAGSVGDEETAARASALLTALGGLKNES